jgi:hypothetical protein
MIKLERWNNPENQIIGEKIIKSSHTFSNNLNKTDDNCYLDFLPAEILVKIVRYISNLTSQSSFFLTSKKYSEFVTLNLQKCTSICIDNFQPNEKTKKNFLSSKQLINLKYLYILNSDLSKVELDFKNIIGLIIKNSQVKPSFVLRQKSLRYLDVRTKPDEQPFFNQTIKLNDIIEKHPSLYALKLTLGDTEKPSITNYTNLSQLRLIELVDTFETKIDKFLFFTSLQELRILKLGCYEIMRPWQFIDILTYPKLIKLPKLVVVHIEHYNKEENFTQNFLQHTLLVSQPVFAEYRSSAYKQAVEF